MFRTAILYFLLSIFLPFLKACLAFNKCLPFDFRRKLFKVKGADNAHVLNYTNLYAQDKLHSI